VNTNYILNHLIYLTDTFYDSKTKSDIPYINIYSKIIDGHYQHIPAPDEGISCVDDVARAIILAFELFEFFNNKEARTFALRMLNFIEYMTDEDGYVTNFIFSSSGDRKLGIPSSYKGGMWWSARAKWALSKAYKVTHDDKYLNLYRKIKISREYGNDIAGLLVLAELELDELKDNDLVQILIDKIINSIDSGGYFKHVKDEQETHMWGYHELEAVAKVAKNKNHANLMKYCIATLNTLVIDQVRNKYYYSYPDRKTDGLCAYCVSPFIRGLYEMYLTTTNEKVLNLLNNSINWFYGDNNYKTTFYDNKTGRCLDGIHEGRVSTNTGAESAVETGFCEVRRLLLKQPEE